MNFKKFEELVIIDFIESSNCYGHHPMQLAAVNKKSELELNALMHLRTNEIKNRVEYYLNRNDFQELFLSLDFPANDEIKNDFVLLLHLKGKTCEQVLIKEYDVKTGAILNTSDNTEHKIVKHIYNLLIGEK